MHETQVPPRATRRWLVRSILVAAGLAMPLVALELVLRLTGAGGPAAHGASFDRERVHYLPEPERANPWLAGVGKEGEVLTLTVVGDSFTAGQGVDWDDALPARLERLLNLNAGVPPADVRAFARRGTSTHDQLRFLDPAFAAGPDLLLLVIFLNDAESHRDPELAVWHERMLPRLPPAGWVPLLRGSRALGWLYTRFEGMRVDRTARAYYSWLYRPDSPGRLLFDKALAVFAARCREAGVPLAAVVFPGLWNLGPRYPHVDVHRRLGEALDTHGIPHLDLLPAFADKSPQRMTAYPGIDNHPSEIAHRVAAREIFRWLVKTGLVDGAYAPRRTRRADDYLAMLRRMRSVPWR